MTSKLNIFNSLPQHASDSEDETTAKNAKTRINKEKQEQRKQEHSKGIGHGHPAPKNAGEKEDVTRQKQAHKTKGVSGEPHPQDRQSGTGSQAYGAKPKKAGAGKGNWGNFKEDRRPAEEGEEVESPEVVEEEKPEGQTLAEYLASKRTVESAPQVNEAKSKITSEQLMKEVGKATLMKNRVQQDIDDKKVGKKKGKLDVDHHAGINTEHSDLLNFRTGFVEKEYRDRARGEEGTTAPRKFAPRREKAEEAPATEAPAVEGEQPAEATTEAKTEEKTAEKTTEKRREGGNRGGRGGYQKGGDRAERGERRPYQGNKPSAAKVNFEDEAAFPKLG